LSREEKLIQRLQSIPSDFTYEEAILLSGRFGYKEMNKGKTSGSRVLLYRENDGRKIMLHKPHPGNIMKKYAVRDLLIHFVENGDIKL